MINIDDLKPILEPLISEREDASTIIESVQSIDKPVEFDRTEIDKEWNERFKKAFFGSKGTTLEDEPPQVKELPEEPEDKNEEIKISDLFEEDKKED